MCLPCLGFVLKQDFDTPIGSSDRHAIASAQRRAPLNDRDAPLATFENLLSFALAGDPFVQFVVDAKGDS